MRTEKTVTIIIFIGLLFKLLHWPGAGPILVMSFTTMAMVYLPSAFCFFCDRDIKRQNIALSIISGLFFSIIIMGILFKIMYWPGAQDLLSLGVVSAPITLVIVYFLNSRSTDELKTYYQNMLLRSSLITVLTILFYLTSTSTLLKVQHWDNPELAQIKILHYTNPDNIEYKKQYDDYILKHK